MKTILLLVVFPLQLFAQSAAETGKNITGLWKGTVSSQEKHLPYELAITEKNGKLSGYSHTTFFVNGAEIVSIKKVTIRLKDQSIIVEDDEMLYNNFTSEAPKKIKQTNKLYLKDEGTQLKLAGTFETKSPMLRPASGEITLVKKDSPIDTKLIAKLDELNLSGSLSFSFVATKLAEPIVISVPAAEKIIPDKPTDKSITAKATLPAEAKQQIPQAEKINTVENDASLAITNPLPKTVFKNEVLIAGTANSTTKKAIPGIVGGTALKKDAVLSEISGAVVKNDNIKEDSTEIVMKPIIAIVAAQDRQIDKSPVVEVLKPSEKILSARVDTEKNKTVTVEAKPAITSAVAKKESPAEMKESLAKEKIIARVIPVATPDNKKNTSTIVSAKPPVKTNPVVTATSKPAVAVVKLPAPPKPVVAAKPAVVVAVAKIPVPVQTKIAVVTKPAPVNISVAPALDLAKRKIETIEQLFIESDSLQFTLYDNGEIDGDTVSIVLNGKTIVHRQGLNTNAFTKTVYITPDLGDTIQLIMYAENLGTLPPNTGLLVLQYDNKRQEIRFSGDLNKNAAITLRRKEKN